MQKSSHPDFNIKKSDIVIYCRTNGDLACEKIEYISLDFIKTYYTRNSLEISSHPIFESQIIGKVVSVIENNIWNSISIKCWEISINSLNLRSLLIKF